MLAVDDINLGRFSRIISKTETIVGSLSNTTMPSSNSSNLPTLSESY